MPESESPKLELRVVLGDRYYRVERPWGVLPPGVEIGTVSQLAVDSRGRLHLFRRDDPTVLVFEPDGQLAGSLADGLICDAHGIFIAADDRLYLVDRDAHQVIILNADGTPAGALGERHHPRLGAPFNHPTDVAVAADGDIYVADGYGNSVVHRFNAAHEHIHSWGGQAPVPVSLQHRMASGSIDATGCW